MKIAIKASFGLCLIAYMVYRASPTKLIEIFSDVTVGLLILSFIFYALASLFEITKLYVLIKSFLSFIQTVRLVLIGLFFNTLLPTSIGGDLYKVVKLNSFGSTTDGAIAFVLFDRVIGILTLLFWCSIYCAFNREYISRLQELPITVSTLFTPQFYYVAIGIILTCVIALIVLRKKSKQLVTIFLIRVKSTLKILKEFALKKYVLQFTLSTLFHSCRLVAILLLIKCLGSELLWVDLIPTLTLVAIFSLLPISIGGIGVREGVLATTLVFMGIEPGVATAVAFMNMFVVLSKAGIGGIVLALHRN